MSPRWAVAAGFGLYFYFDEAHQRPHVAVQRGGEGATLDLATGDVLAGSLPPRALRRARKLLAEHRDEALQAFTDPVINQRLPRKLEQ